MTEQEIESADLEQVEAMIRRSNCVLLALEHARLATQEQKRRLDERAADLKMKAMVKVP